jgi:hypothetical protein
VADWPYPGIEKHVMELGYDLFQGDVTERVERALAIV